MTAPAPEEYCQRGSLGDLELGGEVLKDRFMAVSVIISAITPSGTSLSGFCQRLSGGAWISARDLKGEK
jgi:hypothetical protein